VGVEYSHYLLPVRPLQRPSAERIVRLVGALRREGFLPADARAVAGRGEFVSSRDRGRAPHALTAEFLRHRKSMIRMRWEMGPPLRHPLTRPPYDHDAMTWAIELHWSRHYLPTPAAELDRGLSLSTDCGDALTRRAAFSSKRPFTTWVLSRCPSCRGEVDVEAAEATYESPWTGARRALAGAGLHRFALVVDCGKAVPEDPEGQPVRVHEDVVRLAREHLACSFHDDVGAFG
jgi:hypothetical protein